MHWAIAVARVVDLRQALPSRARRHALRFRRPQRDGELAQRRYEQVNATFRREIESVAEELKRKY